MEREEYEVVVEGGKLWYKKSRELVNTPKGDKWIFVMSASGRLYVAQKQKGIFQHSSFLAGGAAKAAGRLLVNHGTLELMEAHSGHYRPTQENFSCLVKVLEELGTDFSMAKVQAVSDDMLLQKSSSGRVAEPNGNVTTEEFLVEGVSVPESGPGQLAGAKGMLEAEDNTIEDETSSYQQERRVYGFHVHVLDQKALKISTPVDGKSIEDLNTAVSDTPKTRGAATGGLKKEEADIAKLVLVPPENPEGALRWTSEAGPRIASVADVPSEMLSKVF